MLATFGVDANRSDEHQIVARMQPVDLDDRQVDPRQIGIHEGVRLLFRQGHKASRRRRFRDAACQRMLKK